MRGKGFTGPKGYPDAKKRRCAEKSRRKSKPESAERAEAAEKMKQVEVEDRLHAGGAVQRLIHLPVVVKQIRRDAFYVEDLPEREHFLAADVALSTSPDRQQTGA